MFNVVFSFEDSDEALLFLQKIVKLGLTDKGVVIDAEEGGEVYSVED